MEKKRKILDFEEVFEIGLLVYFLKNIAENF